VTPGGPPVDARTPWTAGRSGRELAAAVTAGLLAGAVVSLAAGRPWASARVRLPGLPTSVVSVSGSDVLPVVSALAAVIVAGAVATVAVRGLGRRLCGLAVAGAGVAVVVVVARAEPAVLAQLQDQMVGAAGGSPRRASEVELSLWRWLCCGGGTLAAAFGLVVWWRGWRWPGLGARYEAPAAHRPNPDTDVWTALDRGEDPTRTRSE